MSHTLSNPDLHIAVVREYNEPVVERSMIGSFFIGTRFIYQLENKEKNTTNKRQFL